MKGFFSKLTESLSNVADKSGDKLKLFKEKVEGFDSNPQYRDFKNSIVNPNFSGIKTDLENVMSSELALNGKNPYLNDLSDCLHEVNSFLNGQSKVDKKGLASRVFMALRDFFLYSYLSENAYLKPLSLKRSQLMHKDDYGDVRIEPWFDEVERFAQDHSFDVNYFIEANTTYELRNRYVVYGAHLNFHYENDKFSALYSDIDSVLDSFIEDEDSVTTDDLSLVIDPYEYERAIAEVISSLGADARVTQGSGDQGADVIATYEDENYIIQCKLYSKPVGNKAVQEVAAAKQFYEGDYAMVVTNSSFTKSARMLAEKLDVLLLHHSQIEQIFGEGSTDSVTIASDEGDLYELMIESLSSPDTEKLKEHTSEFLSIFEPTVSENMFVFDVGDRSSFVACFASHDDDVFRTYIDYLFKLTDGLSYCYKILFTLNDLEADTLRYAESLDIRLFTDEKILDYLQELIDTHIDE